MRARTGLIATVLTALVLPGPATAGGPAGFFAHGRYSGSDAAIAGAAYGAAGIGFSAAGNTYGGGWREDYGTLIVDVLPLGAQIALDGRPLGAAGGLVALALTIPLGTHVLQAQAPGHLPRAWRFVADGGFPVQIRERLRPE